MEALIERLRVAAHSIPTDAPEADGTFAWGRTVLVTVEVSSGKLSGLGYTYADQATASLIQSTLAAVVLGGDACAPTAANDAMIRAVRNLGLDGVAAMAVSAIDIALWDLKAKLLGLALVELLGPVRARVGIYGSGGFTSYDEAELEAQLGGWAAQGISAVKLKVGSHPDRDVERVRQARSAVGDECELFVDANGAYSRKQAHRAVAGPGLMTLGTAFAVGSQSSTGSMTYDLPSARCGPNSKRDSGTVTVSLALRSSTPQASRTPPSASSSLPPGRAPSTSPMTTPRASSTGTPA